MTTVPVGDVSLCCSDVGAAAVTILGVHGGPGVDGSLLRHWLAPATAYARVVVPDLRGHGRSDMADATTWTLDHWADDLDHVIEELQLSPVVLLGMSFGGFVVQRFLARHPGKVAGAVLLSTSTRRATGVEMVARFAQVGGEVAGRAMARSLRDRSDEALEQWTRVCGPLLNARPYDEATRRVDAERISTSDVNRHFASTAAEMDLTPGLALARDPVLVLVGDSDPLVPMELAREVATAMPPGLAEFQVIPNAAHTLLWDAPGETHAAVAAFVAEVVRPDPA